MKNALLKTGGFILIAAGMFMVYKGTDSDEIIPTHDPNILDAEFTVVND